MSSKIIYLVVGCPGVGKTWVCKQLEGKFLYVAHDDHPDEGLYTNFLAAAAEGEKPVVGEIPFGLSKIQAALEESGIHVIPVFILEREKTIEARYWMREKREIPKGHLTRQKTYAARARELSAFAGTAEEVLAHLKGVVS
jgi:ATP-dependent Lon protease